MGGQLARCFKEMYTALAETIFLQISIIGQHLPSITYFCHVWYCCSSNELNRSGWTNISTKQWPTVYTVLLSTATKGSSTPPADSLTIPSLSWNLTPDSQLFPQLVCVPSGKRLAHMTATTTAAIRLLRHWKLRQTGPPRSTATGSTWK